MGTIHSKARLIAASTGMLAAALVAGAAAPGPKPLPDFSSNGTAWEGPALGEAAEFIRVPGSPPLVTNDPAHPYVSNETFRRTGKQPAYRIADLTNPNLKPWAKEIMKKDNDEVLAGKIAYAPAQACEPSGVPGYMLPAGPYYFIQTPGKVLIIEADEGQARRIYLNVGHSAGLKPSWYGESVGHYEGDTLVVDTIGLNARTFIDTYRTPHSEKLHVIERFKMIEDDKTLEVHVTVDDSDTYYEPWQGTLRFARVQAILGEEICREGNFTLFDYHIPVAARPDF